LRCMIWDYLGPSTIEHHRQGLSMSEYSRQLDRIASSLEDLATDVLKGSYEAAVLYSMIRNVASDLGDVARELKRQGL
jgi:hypothetical protein